MDIKLDVNKVLEEIAKGLGVAVEKLYPLLYKQAIIDGLVNLLWVSLIIIGTIAYFKFTKFAIRKVHQGIKDNDKSEYIKTDWSDYPMYVISIVFGGIVVFALVITGMELIEDSITALINTEYYMIEKVVSQFKSN